MNKEDLSRLLTSLSRNLVLLLAFLMPIFFLPVTGEFYEFNKHILLIGASSVLLILWALRSYLDGRISLIHTPVDVSVIVFWVVNILATVFSLDRYVSIFGFYPRFYPSLATVTSLTALYFTISSLAADKAYVRRVATAVVLSTTIAAAFQVISFFGIQISSTAWLQSRSWTPQGIPNNLAFIEAFVLPIAWGLLITGKNRLQMSPIWLVCTAILTVSISTTNITSVWITLAAAVLLTLAVGLPVVMSRRAIVGPVVLITAAAVLLFAFAPIRNNVVGRFVQNKNANLPAESQIDVPKEPILPQNVSWAIAASTLRNRPFFGTGPGTFFYDFTRNKPVEMSRTNLWDVRFDRPSSDFTGTLATLGIIGFAAWIVMVLYFAKNNLALASKNDDDNLHKFLLIAGATFLIAQFFAPSPITGAALFIIITSLAYNAWGRDLNPAKFHAVTLTLEAKRTGFQWATEGQSRSSGQTQILSLLFLFVAVAASLFLGFSYRNAYAAEIAYQKSLVALTQNKGQDVYNYQVEALKTNPDRDLYHRSLTLTNLSLARSLNSKGDKLTDADKQTITQLVAQALNEGKIATGYQVNAQPGTTAVDVRNWEALAAVYQNLIGASQGAETHAVNTLSQALALDPFNVRLNEAMGNLASSIGDKDGAIRFYQDATNIKPDYPSAHYNLAQVFKAKGDNPTAVAIQLQTVLNLIGPDDTNRDRIQKEYDEAKIKADEAIKKAQEAAKNQQPLQSTPAAQPAR